jgi:DNA repair protein RecO (recombination protein O)
MARPDRLYKTEAIILRRQDFKEYDRLITVLTPTYGKFTVIAKGVRRPTGRMAGHVELFSRSQMMIARGRDLDILSQCELNEPYLALRDDLDCTAYAHYSVELLDRFTEPDEENTVLYNLLAGVLSAIAEHAADLRLIARFYELRLLAVVGFQPELFHCVIGHEPIEPQDQFFSAFDGGAICPEHAENNPYVQPISLGALKVLRYLQREPFEQIRHLQLRDLLHLELERVMQSYLIRHLERRLKSADFIRQITLHRSPSTHPQP